MGQRKRSRVSKKQEEEEEEEEEVPHQESEVGHQESIFEKKSLYEILGVEKTASQQEIKKAYYKLALCLHPDKNPGDKEANEKFQLLQKVVSVLGDEDKRAFYDQTGVADDNDDFVGNAANNMQEFFRTMYKKVTEVDIEEFEANYRGSDSEKKDLKDLYLKYKGNMKRLFCSMLCSYPNLDSHRFKGIIDEAIAEGELKATQPYKKWAKQISEIKPPQNPLGKRRRPKKRPETDFDLCSAILEHRRERKAKFNSFLSSVMAKCGKQAEPEPTEEEFQIASRRVERCKRLIKRLAID